MRLDKREISLLKKLLIDEIHKNNQVYLKITNPKSEQHLKRILTMQRKLLLKLLNFEKE